MKNRSILYISVLLIFLIFLSFSISNYYLEQKYNKISGLNDEINEVKNLINNSQSNQAIIKLDKIENDIKFIQGVCLK